MSTVRVTAAEGEVLRVTVLKAVEEAEMKPTMVMEGGGVFLRNVPTGANTTRLEAIEIVQFASESREFDVGPGLELKIEAVEIVKSSQGRKVKD